MANDANNPANVDSHGNPLPVDTTSADKPYRFWVNDDQDDQENTETVPVTVKDYTLGTIHTKRNLEDFQRLWIYTKGLNQAIHDGAIRVGLQWENVTGTPAINVYSAVETDGGTKYLTDDTTAAQQITGAYNTTIAQVTGTSSVMLPSSLFTNLSETSPKTYLLFEGAGIGSGKLTLVFFKSVGGTLTRIGEGGQVYMNLKTVQDMYVHATAQPTGGITNPYEYYPVASPGVAPQPPNNPAGTVTPDTEPNFEAPADEAKQCILYVHGWNVTQDRYWQQSTAGFKRLWLQGYKGRYAAIRWPSDISQPDDYGWWRTVQNAINYYRIEYWSFKYATAVKQYASSLNGQGFTVNVIAHSMGAIATSEAWLQGAPFTKVVVFDGAVSAGCYDTSTVLTQDGSGSSWGFPNHQPLAAAAGGYNGYFTPLSGIANFYNPDDSALGNWVLGNTLFKGIVVSGLPDPDANTGAVYVYNDESDPNTPGVALKHIYNDPTTGNLTYTFRKVFEGTQKNYHESMSMYAASQTLALGAEPRTGGAATPTADLRTFFPGSTSHSAQFDFNVQGDSSTHGQKPCWTKVLQSLGQPIPPGP